MKIIKSVFLMIAFLSLACYSTYAYFTSQAKVENNIFATGEWPAQQNIVINEVYYFVGADKGDEGDASNPDEWIELYNPNNFAISLKDWTITDNSTVRTIHADKSIPANGFAFLEKSNSTSGYWSVPAGVEIIELGQKIGNGLDNGGDRVILKNPSANIIDQLSYGDDVSILNPAVTGVVQGHSIGRSPLGHDTDSAADFVDQASPTPGS